MFLLGLEFSETMYFLPGRAALGQVLITRSIYADSARYDSVAGDWTGLSQPWHQVSEQRTTHVKSCMLNRNQPQTRNSPQSLQRNHRAGPLNRGCPSLSLWISGPQDYTMTAKRDEASFPSWGEVGAHQRMWSSDFPEAEYNQICILSRMDDMSARGKTWPWVSLQMWERRIKREVNFSCTLPAKRSELMIGSNDKYGTSCLLSAHSDDPGMGRPIEKCWRGDWDVGDMMSQRNLKS